MLCPSLVAQLIRKLQNCSMRQASTTSQSKFAKDSCTPLSVRHAGFSLILGVQRTIPFDTLTDKVFKSLEVQDRTGICLASITNLDSVQARGGLWQRCPVSRNLSIT